MVPTNGTTFHWSWLLHHHSTFRMCLKTDLFHQSYTPITPPQTYSTDTYIAVANDNDDDNNDYTEYYAEFYTQTNARNAA